MLRLIRKIRDLFSRTPPVAHCDCTHGRLARKHDEAGTRPALIPDYWCERCRGTGRLHPTAGEHDHGL